MNCKECGQFFQPPPEEEKLITTGGLPILCPDCERKRWESKKPPQDRAPIYPGVPYKGDGTELYRVARFDERGIETTFLALPQRPFKAVAAPLRKVRKHDVHVFVMSERNSQLNTTPRTRILTNIDTYQKQNKPLKITKIPDYWDPFTGVGTIEVKQDDIVDIVDEDLKKRVNLKDGGCVVFYYR